ncbi:MAG: twin-arginine translocase TatA/TatE family subunit [Bacteroidota bacterium]
MSNTLFLFFNLSPGEVMLAFGAVLLLFGGKKIPELMRGLGKGIKEFNNARSNVEEELKEGMKDADRKKLEERRAAEKVGE